METVKIMRKYILKNVGILMFVLAMLVGFESSISAQRAQRGQRISDKQVRNLLQQIETHSDSFKRTLDRALDRSTLNGTRYEDEINGYVSDFENATDNLKSRFNNKAEVSSDVQDVLNRGGNIDVFLRRNQFNSATTRSWSFLRTDLSALARFYNDSWNWNSSDTINNDNYSYNDNQLNGTYQLNSSESTNVSAEIDKAIRNANVSSDRQQRIRENAFQRLESPQMLAFERVNSTVTIASSNTARLTIEADGRDSSEQMDNGRTMKTRARFNGQNLMIDFTGDKMNDYYLTFEPIRNTKTLRVTRRLNLEGINREISVYSVYDRTSNTADWNNVYPNSGNGNNNDNNFRDFFVPNGTNLTTVLNNEISTNKSVEGDRFSFTVNSPSQYNGAMVEGRISKLERSGKLSGRAEMTLDFEQITLRNGKSYRFAGFIQSVKDSNGESVRISNEGEIKSNDNQTTKTVTRAGVGAVLGALIGAIINGGQGAAIGAGIGAGAGTGSVLIQGRDDLKLSRGTEVVISASSPRQLAKN
jgi:YMGG-like Gly-zipper